MQPSIFGKDLASVEFADVVAFCNQKPKEGLGLDYKKDLSSLENVVKTLVSFANTNGGWVIVGVEDEDDAPKLPVTGMKDEDNFEQRINNSIVSSVSPIVLPTYKKCVSPDGKKAFLIAFMPPSQAAPHFMQYKGKHVLFIRIADRSKSQEWEDYAAAPQWELLRNRRQASIDLRNQLLELMKDVYEAKALAGELDRQKNDPSPLAAVMSPTATYFSGEHYEKAQTISILPMYPSSPVTDVHSTLHMLSSEPIRNGMSNRRPLTPDHRGHDTKLYQKGAYGFHKDEATDRYYFYGLDIYGNMLNVDPLEFTTQIPTEDGSGKRRIFFLEITHIVMDIVGALKFAAAFYAEYGLIGSLLFRVEFAGTEDSILYITNTGWSFHDIHNMPHNVTGRYLIQKEIDTNTLADISARNAFVSEVMKEILYSFNYGSIADDKLLELIKRAAADPSTGYDA